MSVIIIRKKEAVKDDIVEKEIQRDIERQNNLEVSYNLIYYLFSRLIIQFFLPLKEILNR